MTESYHGLAEEAVKHLSPLAARRVLHLTDTLQDALASNGNEIADWPDPDKLRALAAQLYMEDWEKGDYDSDAVQADLIRIADSLEEQ